MLSYWRNMALTHYKIQALPDSDSVRVSFLNKEGGVQLTGAFRAPALFSGPQKVGLFSATSTIAAGIRRVIESASGRWSSSDSPHKRFPFDPPKMDEVVLEWARNGEAVGSLN